MIFKFIIILIMCIIGTANVTVYCLDKNHPIINLVAMFLCYANLIVLSLQFFGVKI